MTNAVSDLAYVSEKEYPHVPHQQVLPHEGVLKPFIPSSIKDYMFNVDESDSVSAIDTTKIHRRALMRNYPKGVSPR